MKKIIVLIISAILFSMIIIIVKGQFENKLLNNANYGMPYLIHKKTVENLFVGSSMFRQGLDSKILEENGISNYILSYNGNNPILELWTLQHLLKSKVSIKNLYIDMYAYSLSSKPSISDSKILMEVDLNGKYELYKMVSDGINLSDLYHIFVSKNMELILTWPIYYKLVNATYYNGGIKIGMGGIEEEKIKKIKMIETNSIAEENIESIKEIIKICKELNINLYFLETPKSYRVMNDQNYQKLMKEYKKVLDENDVNYLLAEDVNDSISGNSYNFFDLIHLSNDGRHNYTSSLVDSLKIKRFK